MPELAQPLTSGPSARWSEVIPLTDLPPMLDQAISRLRELSQLADNWDGYGSPRITEAAKRSAIALLAELRSYAIPGMHLDGVPGGGLQFEWEIGPRALEIEILPDGALEYLVAERDDMLEGVLNDPSTLLVLLRWLMRC